MSSMSRRSLRRTAGTAVLAALTLASLPAVSAAAETVSPLPDSDYAVRPACSQPAPGDAGCFADELVPVTSEARRHHRPLGMVAPATRLRSSAPSPRAGELGLRPQDIHTAYSLPDDARVPQTIALVDAYNDPQAEADLAAYDAEFGIPACTSANGCFEQTGQSPSGTLPYPASVAELEQGLESSDPALREEAEEAAGWGVEISLDIETAHATCQSCRILLVEADSQGLSDLTAAVGRAEELGATEISNSWGAPEEAFETAAATRAPYNDPGVVITASAGDDGYRNWDAERLTERGFTSFPAASPDVVAVGGTRLATLGPSGEWRGETVWNGSGAGGGGCSTRQTAQPWQREASDWSSVGCGTHRAVSDVSADADPYSGVAVRDSDAPGELCETEYEESEEKFGKKVTVERSEPYWCTYGGTSLASPLIAGVFALAGGANGRAYPAQTLYETERGAPGYLHDVTSGSNGECLAGYDRETGRSLCTAASEASRSCSSQLICLAAPGYDGPSGVGTPDGVLGFEPREYDFAPSAPESPSPGPSATAGSSAPAPAPAPKTSATPAPTVPVVSSLQLTPVSVIALDRRPTTGKVAFSFLSNMSARTVVTLARRVRAHGRYRWVTLGRARTIAALAGRNHSQLTGRTHLPSGTYRLMVAPSGGAARSLLFHIG